MLSHVDGQTNGGRTKFNKIQRYGGIIDNISLLLQSAGRRAATKSIGSYSESLEIAIRNFHQCEDTMRRWYDLYMEQVLPELQKSK